MTTPRQLPPNYIPAHKRVWGQASKDKDYIKHAYIRVGIYYPAQQNGRRIQVNFFDLHFMGAVLDGSSLKGWYSGPTKSIFQILANNRLRRQKDEDQLLASDTVDERYRLSNGGIAALGVSKKHNDATCWLFGPLSFGCHKLGSLHVKLHGLHWPTLNTHHAAGKYTHRYLWPKQFGTRQGRCTLWGSYYTGVQHSFFTGALKDIPKQIKHTFPVDPAIHFTWRVEAYSGELRFEEAEQQRDTNKDRHVAEDG